MNKYIVTISAAVFALSVPGAALAEHHEGGVKAHKCEKMEDGKMKCCMKDKDGKMACHMMDGDKMDHGKMDHGTMDHGTMDHGQMDHGDMAQPETPDQEPQ